MQKLGRFPLMVLFQYMRAYLLGYSKEQAKAIGYAQAVKYAIFKNIGGRRRTGKSNGFSQAESKIAEINQKAQYIKNKTFNITFTADNKWPIISNKIITDKDFDNYFKSFDKNLINKYLIKIHEILKEHNRKDLEVETRFYNNIWKFYRDTLTVEN